MSMNSSLVSSSTFSQDSSYSVEKRTPLSHPIRRVRRWSRQPNQVPNGRLLAVSMVLGAVTFGTAFGLIDFINDTTRDICLSRVESRTANRENFDDLYVTILSLSTESDDIIEGLRERLDARTPPLSEEDC